MARTNHRVGGICCGLLVLCGGAAWGSQAAAHHPAFEYRAAACGMEGETYVLHALELMDRSYGRRDAHCVLIEHAIEDLCMAADLMEPRSASSLLVAAETHLRKYQQTGRLVFLEQAGRLSVQALDVAARHYDRHHGGHVVHHHASQVIVQSRPIIVRPVTPVQRPQVIQQSKRPIGWRNHHNW